MIKYFGEPWKEIKSKDSNKTLFRFDSKGEFITDDEAIISRATGRFDHIEMTAETVGERVPKTYSFPAVVITNNLDEQEPAEPEAEEAKFVCKYCGETFEKSGQRLAHYAHGCSKKDG
jgi:hypothetical protein